MNDKEEQDATTQGLNIIHDIIKSQNVQSKVGIVELNYQMRPNCMNLLIIFAHNFIKQDIMVDIQEILIKMWTI